MVSDASIKRFVFNFLQENGYEINEVIDFGRTKTDNEYCMVCSTDDEEDDFMCWFIARQEEGKIKLSNIRVM